MLAIVLLFGTALGIAFLVRKIISLDTRIAAQDDVMVGESVLSAAVAGRTLSAFR
jgi:hypothetical protein